MELALGEAGAEGLHDDARALELAGQGLGEREHEGLARRVHGEERHGLEGRRGHDVDHSAALALDHAGQEAARQLHHRARVEVDHREEPLPRQLVKATGEADAGVVDEKVHLHTTPAELHLQRRARVRPREVEGDEVGLVAPAQFPGERRQPVGPPGDEDETGAAAGEGAREGLADAAGGAGDEGPPLGQAQLARARSLAEDAPGTAAGTSAPRARIGAAFWGERQLSKSATLCTQLTVQ